MNISVKAYPAKDGDCLLVCFGLDDTNQTYILIDSGYNDTVTNHLIKDLEKIKREGHVLEKFIITHVDKDHIQGAVEFLKCNSTSKIIDIKQIWHNTYRHLFNGESDPLEKSNDKILQQIIRRGYPKDKGNKESKVISAAQGTTVGALILKGGYHWNTDFNQLAVSVNNGKRIKVNDDASIYLLSPDNDKLDKLKKLWAGELKKFGINYIQGGLSFYDDAFEMLLSWEKEQPKLFPKQISKKKQTIEELLGKNYHDDNTATNGSSIAFVLQIRERKLLFLADAHSDIVVRSLEEFQSEGTIIFDLIKVSHHGSFRNISSELLNKIDSESYLISTNGGRHNHPDKETLAHIVTRKTKFKRQLFFNYKTENSIFFENEDWMHKYNYSIHYLEDISYTITL